MRVTQMSSWEKSEESRVQLLLLWPSWPHCPHAASGPLGRGWMAGRAGRGGTWWLSTVWPWSRWLWTRNVLISDRAELSDLIRGTTAAEVTDPWVQSLKAHLILLQNVVLLPHRVAVLLGGNNTWLTGHHMEMMSDLDLWEFPKDWCKETCPVVHRNHNSTIAIHYKLGFVASGRPLHNL